MDMFVSLRIVAIASNVLFGIYGIGEHIGWAARISVSNAESN
jgi:hypothetical protein